MEMLTADAPMPETLLDLDLFLVQHVLGWSVVSSEALPAVADRSLPAVAPCVDPRCGGHLVVRYLPGKGPQPFAPSRDMGAAWIIVTRLQQVDVDPAIWRCFQRAMAEQLAVGKLALALWEFDGPEAAGRIARAVWLALHGRMS
jgi:hypothetical protein